MLIINLIVPPVPTPKIQTTTSRGVLYVGEDLNVTCTSSVMGAVFTWRAVIDFMQQPVILPNTTINISAHSSVLIFKPITFSSIHFVEITCTTTLPGNENIIGEKSKLPTIQSFGRLF